MVQAQNVTQVRNGAQGVSLCCGVSHEPRKEVWDNALHPFTNASIVESPVHVHVKKGILIVHVDLQQKPAALYRNQGVKPLNRQSNHRLRVTRKMKKKKKPPDRKAWPPVLRKTLDGNTHRLAKLAGEPRNQRIPTEKNNRASEYLSYMSWLFKSSPQPNWSFGSPWISIVVPTHNHLGKLSIYPRFCGWLLVYIA